MVGKRVVHRTYAHVSLLPELSGEDRQRIDQAIKVSSLTTGEHFHVVRLDREHDEVALLSYPTFFDELYPGLLASWRVHLPTQAVRFRDYSNSLNPPILHRKELMLPTSHPDQLRLQQITGLAESIGLFDDPVRIGFREQWKELVASKGYAVVGQELQPTGNLTEASTGDTSIDPTASGTVLRHLTALSRSFLSAPVQALLRHDLLKPGRSFFDYGCGRGHDLEGIRSLGITAEGWDPHYRTDGLRQTADVVNLGFVINVIENMDERIEALKGAYALAQGVLSVSAMLCTPGVAKGRPYGDGYLTSRNTFQRYYSQGDLQSFIESVLDEQATPIGPGVFFVFRDRYLEQQFLSTRQSDRTRATRLLTARQCLPRALRSARPGRSSVDEDPNLREAAAAIWKYALEIGRLPDQEEYPAAADAIHAFGSWKRALRSAASQSKPELLEDAAKQRSDEIRVIFAMQAFGRRKHLRDLEPRLRRDIKAFFGSLSVAEAEGRRLLHQCADVDSIRAACEQAAAQGLGFLDADHSLQLHTSLVSRLLPVLRVYVGCATAVYGDVLSADLVKIHIQSGKLTLMRFDDFVGSPLPRMVQRVKVRLRDQELDFFEYGNRHPSPFLYFKSRYINEEFAGFPEQQHFDQELESLGLAVANGYGPAPDEFAIWLQQRRREVKGMRLVPSTRIPSMDELCGQHFVYRQLIECGETWERTRAENTPRSPDTYNALFELATKVLDPVIEYFGGIKLTYGFASAELTRQIRKGISPSLDQHIACETNKYGNPKCSRRGAAVDFLVEDEDMREVAKWISRHCEFDRLYFYGSNRPLHVSVGPQNSRLCFTLGEVAERRIPRKVSSF